MTTLRLKPNRGGFLRPFGCGWFIREFVAGNAPYGSPVINPTIGAPQADIFHYYKEALRQASAMDRAIRMETKRAKREKRSIDPNNINSLYQWYLARTPYKAMAAAIIALSPTSLICNGWAGWSLPVRWSRRPSRATTHPARLGSTSALLLLAWPPLILPGRTPSLPSMAGVVSFIACVILSCGR